MGLRSGTPPGRVGIANPDVPSGVTRMATDRWSGSPITASILGRNRCPRPSTRVVVNAVDD